MLASLGFVGLDGHVCSRSILAGAGAAIDGHGEGAELEGSGHRHIAVRHGELFVCVHIHRGRAMHDGEGLQLIAIIRGDGQGDFITFFSGRFVGFDLAVFSGFHGDGVGRRVVAGGKGEPCIFPKSLGFLIIVKGYGLAANEEAVTIGNRAGVIADHEQPAILTHGTLIAVGNIHQVEVIAVQGDNVPHVSACASAAAHRASNGVALYIFAFPVGHVAQVLERLGIAFANDLGVGIAVKDVDHLPGIAVAAGVVRLDRVKVVIHIVANVFLIGKKLIVVAFASVLRNNGLGIGCG